MNWLLAPFENLPIRDPVLVFALAMCVILLAPSMARKLKLPDIIGLILAGILLGEHGLHILERDETMVLLGTVGLLYIMFLAGLEIDLDQFIRHRRDSIIFGMLTFLIPITVGTLAARYLLSFSLPAAILLASMFASHTLLAYPIVNKLGITRNRAVTAAIGGTIITDTLALLILAVIAAAALGDLTGWFWLQISLSLVVFVLVISFGVPPLARFYFRRYSDRGTLDFAFVMAIGFLSAYFAQLAGLEAIIGAFFGGLALNRSIPLQSPLMSRIHFAGNAIFIPFFLLSVGMLVNIGRLAGSAYIWLVGGTMVVTALITKWGAAIVAGRWLRFSPAESRVVFGLSVAQAAATLAAVFVGFRIELFGEEVLNGAIMMILVTCIVSPAFVDRYGRAIALEEDVTPLKPGDAPLRILIPMANPDSTSVLMDIATMIRRPQSPEPVFPLTVASQHGDVEKQVANSERMLGHAVMYAASAGIPVQPATRVDGNIANGITRAVKELRISTIIIGWTGTPSRNRPGMGRVIDQLLRDNTLSLLVCRLLHPVHVTQRLILLCPPLLEREPGFGETIRMIKQLASQCSADLHIHAIQREIKHLQPRLEKIRPQAAIEYHDMTEAQWKQRDFGAIQPDKNDVILLLSTREGRLAWNPAMRSLPLHLAERYAATNLVVVYPAEQEIISVSERPETLLAADRTFLQVSPMPLPELLQKMLQSFFPDRAVLANTVEQLTSAAQAGAIEMAPGLSLIHAHIAGVNEPLILLSTCRSSFELGPSQSASALVVLLSPKSRPPEHHLRTLALIAKMIQQEHCVERLQKAHSFEEVQAAIKPSALPQS